MSASTLINFDGQTEFKVLTGETYTVGETMTAPSPSGASSGVSPTTAFDGKRASVGGQVYAGFSDAAGPAQVQDSIQFAVKPRDVIAVSAIGSGKATVTLNGVAMGVIAATTVCGVLGYWG